MGVRLDIFGWFEDTSATPTHDPGVETGICPHCTKPLQRPVVTASLMLMGGNRSYFYRLHKSCQLSMSPQEVLDLDHSLIDSLIAQETDKT